MRPETRLTPPRAARLKKVSRAAFGRASGVGVADAGVADAAWLTQAYLLLEDVRAGESMAKASHLCALICGRDDLYSCAQGPGVAAAWLVMRTMGLARPPHAGGGSGRAVSRVSTSR